MVTEVVSADNDLDPRAKPADYAAMGIPIYLVVDPRKSQSIVTVYSDPHPRGVGAHYRACHVFEFGDAVEIRLWRIETSRFPRYEDG